MQSETESGGSQLLCQLCSIQMFCCKNIKGISSVCVCLCARGFNGCTNRHSKWPKVCGRTFTVSL